MPDRLLSRTACFETSAIGKSTSASRLHSLGIIGPFLGYARLSIHPLIR